MPTDMQGSHRVVGYRDLKVWRQGMDLVASSYRLMRRLPASETYGLASQIRRAAVAIPANIAEGHGREHLGDYLRHLSVANGSLMELETELLIAQRLGFLTEAECAPAFLRTAELARMLAGLTRSLKRRYSKP